MLFLTILLFSKLPSGFAIRLVIISHVVTAGYSQVMARFSDGQRVLCSGNYDSAFCLYTDRVRARSGSFNFIYE